MGSFVSLTVHQCYKKRPEMLNAEPREKVRRGLSALQILVQVLVQFILGEILNAFILQAFIQRKKKMT